MLVGREPFRFIPLMRINRVYLQRVAIAHDFPAQRLLLRYASWKG